jgi:hypothetical protein
MRIGWLATLSSCSTITHPAHRSPAIPNNPAAARTQAFRTNAGSVIFAPSVVALARRPSLTTNPASSATSQARISGSTSSALRSRAFGSEMPSTRHASTAAAGRSTPLEVSSWPGPTQSASLRARDNAGQFSAAPASSAETTAGEGIITPATLLAPAQPGVSC